MTTVKTASFTIRELQVIRGVGEGKTSVEIAKDLGLSNESIRFYLKRLRDKTEIRRKSMLAVWATGHRREIDRHLKAKEKDERRKNKNS